MFAQHLGVECHLRDFVLHLIALFHVVAPQDHSPTFKIKSSVGQRKLKTIPVKRKAEHVRVRTPQFVVLHVPLLASSRESSFPMPEFAPVTITVFP